MERRDYREGPPRAIANDDLQLTDVPKLTARWSTICYFALTSDGYEIHGSPEVCAAIANERRNATLSDLRTCLFFEQRRCHHFVEMPNTIEMKYIRGLVSQIRERILNRRA